MKRIPNAKTIAAIKELEAGGGKTYRGSARKILNHILHGNSRRRKRDCAGRLSLREDA